MSIHLLPQKLAVLAALTAFGVAAVAGFFNDVPIHVVAFRAALAGAAFWALGLAAGRVVMDGICEAIGQTLATDEQPQTRTGGKK